jgi:hypothetical protein
VRIPFITPNLTSSSGEISDSKNPKYEWVRKNGMSLIIIQDYSNNYSNNFIINTNELESKRSHYIEFGLRLIKYKNESNFALVYW